MIALRTFAEFTVDSLVIGLAALFVGCNIIKLSKGLSDFAPDGWEPDVEVMLPLFLFGAAIQGGTRLVRYLNARFP